MITLVVFLDLPYLWRVVLGKKKLWSLLENGADATLYDGVSKYNDPLQTACSNSNTSIAKKLLTAGSDVNHKGKGGVYGSVLYMGFKRRKED